MGGKRKQSQRTKNNVRPSSSGRSAALLANTTPNFVGFAAVKDCGYVPNLPGVSGAPSDDVDASIDVNFQLVLKKMNKKDSTTRLKALQEFSQLVAADHAGDTVKAVLPCWARLFCQLSLDPEHRVREAAHVAHRAVVRAARRNLAPHLRQLAGPWFTAQYDTHPPAASAATLALQDAFPPKKMIEAIVFCQQEILNYIIDNITVQTAQTLSNPKTTSIEDMESKYQRVLVSSLQGYALFLQKLPGEHLESVQDLNKKLISSKRFWKLASYKAPLVRNAWFSALIAVCQKVPCLLEDYGSQVALSVFGNLDEVDPVVLPTVWEAALHVLTVVQDCWSHVDSEKIVFPKLWSVLREGGQGNAVTIFPNLLPFISKLPPCACVDKEAFYGNFFSNLLQGFKQKTVHQSISESNAVAKCYVECLRYLVNINHNDFTFCKTLQDSHLFSAVELTLKDPSMNYGSFYKELSNLIHHWNRNRTIPIHLELLKSFWSSLSKVNLWLLRKSSPDCLVLKELPAEWQLQRIVDLYMVLKYPGSDVHRKHARVKFASDNGEEDNCDDDRSISPCTEVTKLEVLNEDNGSEFQQDLNNLICDLTVLFFENLETHQSIIYVRPLKMLVDSMLDTESLQNIMARLNGDMQFQIQRFLNETLYNWLQDKMLCIEAVVELIFSLLVHLPHEEKLRTIYHLYKLSESNRSILLWMLRACVKHASDADVADFIRGRSMSGELVALAGEVCSCPEEGDGELITILRYCLKIPTIADTAVPGILRELALGLRRLPSPTAGCSLLASEAAYLAPDFGSAGADLAVGLLLAATSCQDEESHIVEAWQHCAPHLDSSFAHILVADICSLISKQSSVLAVFVSSLAEQLQMLNQEVKQQLLVELRATRDDDVAWLSTACHLGWRLHGRAAGDAVQPPALPGPCLDLRHCAGLVLLSSCLLLQELSTENSDCCAQFYDHLSDTVYCIAAFHEFLIFYSNTSYYNRTYGCVTKLKDEFKKIVQNLKESDIEMISSAVAERAKKEGGLWVWALYHLHNAAFKIEDGQAIYSSLITDSVHKGLPRIHAEQAYFILNRLNNHAVDFAQTELTKTLPTITCWLNNLNEPFLKNGKIVVRHFLEEIRSSYKIAECDMHVCDMSESDWEEVQQVAEKINFLSAAVENAWYAIPLEMWDYILLVLTYFTKGLPNALRILLYEARAQCPLSAIRRNLTFISVVTSRLFRSVDCFFTKCACDDSKELSKKTYKDLLEEWKLVYANDIYQSFRDVANLLAGATNETDVTLDRQIFLEEMGSTLMHIDLTEYLCDLNNQTALEVFIGNCQKMIYSPVNALQLTGYQLLKKMIPALCKKDTETYAACTSLEEQERDQAPAGLLQLLSLVEKGEEEVTHLLVGLKRGEAVSPEPFSTEHANCAAYLLLWTLILEMCAAVSPQLRYQYAATLSEKNCLRNLLSNLFHLMPAEVLKITDVKPKPPKAYLFSTEPSFKFSEPCQKLYLQHLACWVYFSTLKRLPAMVRQWWGEADSRISNMVDRVTTCYVSPLLCMQEMQAIQQQDIKYNYMQVKVHASAREVTAIYSLDEARVELVVKLPANHPLGLVKVESGQRFVGSSQWRNWMMQLTIFLTHQNGSLWDGLMLLKSNLDKRFEGVEECYICFSVLHGSNFQLPKLCCKTCKKKFHSPCLYKWFSTSNKSTCPICRNMF